MLTFLLRLINTVPKSFFAKENHHFFVFFLGTFMDLL